VTVLRTLLRLGTFLYDFAVGDDPVVAVIIVAALTATALVADSGAAAWWILPVAAPSALCFSLIRATKR